MCNKNPATFYREVAAYMAQLTKEGVDFVYSDIDQEPKYGDREIF